MQQLSFFPKVKRDRIALDYYPTWDGYLEITEGLLKAIPEVRSQSIFLPCAGDGAIAVGLTENGCKQVVTNDIDPRFNTDYCMDAACKQSWEQWSFDWAIDNPPFNLAHKILPLALANSRCGVAFLLRLTYYEPTANRKEWLRNHADCMTHLIPVNPRPKFRADTAGVDSATVVWFVFQKDWSWRSQGISCPFQFINFSRG